MKKNLMFIMLAASVVLAGCNNKEKEPEFNPTPAEQWGKTMAGNDPEEITWPDLSENYWEYTMDVSKYPSTGLRIAGQFPNENARFFNITLYDDDTTARIASIEDFNVVPSSGRNPFAEEGVTGDSWFEVNLVPAGTPASVTAGLKNVLEFPASTKRLCLLLRVYFNSIDHNDSFGGVELPSITFFDAATGKATGKAVRAKSTYYDKCAMIVNSVPELQSAQALVFTLAPNIMYSNGPTGYVTAANRMTDGDVLLFRFKPPHSPASISENTTADVRYWSICVGDKATHTPITVPDHSVTMDGEYANFVVIAKNDAMYTQAKAAAEANNINVLTWDREKSGDQLMIFYRQMYIRDGYVNSVQKITAYPPLKGGLPDATAPVMNVNAAHRVLGQYGPSGLKLSTTTLLAPNFADIKASVMRFEGSVEPE